VAHRYSHKVPELIGTAAGRSSARGVVHDEELILPFRFFPPFPFNCFSIRRIDPPPPGYF
jgi:hypothetical protein